MFGQNYSTNPNRKVKVLDFIKSGGPCGIRTPTCYRADPMSLFQRLSEHLHQVLGAAAGATTEPVAAGDAGVGDPGLRRGIYGGKQPLLADGRPIPDSIVLAQLAFFLCEARPPALKYTDDPE